jgi:hypothetical protein
LKQYKTDLIIFLVLLSLAFVFLVATVGQSTIDIQLHDTYFVLDKISMTILVLGPLTFIIFLARGLASKFKSIGSNTGLIIGLALVTLIAYQNIALLNSELDQIKRLEDEGLPDKGQFIADIKSNINWTWGLFSLLTIGVIILTVQTIKIWKKST